MSSFDFPKQNSNQKTGRKGEAFFEYFTSSVLGWIYRPVHQESDFGIDGYVDIVDNGNVTGKSIAVQIKCGNSYVSKKSEGGIKYEGVNKHLNYYLNLQIPVVLVVINGDCSQGFWVEFDIEKTTNSKTGWWIEIPENNKLDITSQNFFVGLAGAAKDFSQEIQNLWAMNETLNNASFLAFAVSKSEVLTGDFSIISSTIKRLTKNREMTLCKRASAEIFFPEYDDDPRELYEIPEVRSWFMETIAQGIPWFYFFEQSKGMGLMLLFCCTCNVEFQGINGDNHRLLVSLEEQKWWLEHNFLNLNKFTESNKISLEVNKEISCGVSNWFMQAFSDLDTLI
jgi:hypothetical protein